MASISLGVPVMMIFAFLPMLAAFNENIKKAAKFAYSQQINILINKLGAEAVSFENIAVISLNIVIAFLLFWFAYKRCGLS